MLRAAVCSCLAYSSGWRRLEAPGEAQGVMRYAVWWASYGSHGGIVKRRAAVTVHWVMCGAIGAQSYANTVRAGLSYLGNPRRTVPLVLSLVAKPCRRHMLRTTLCQASNPQTTSAISVASPIHRGLIVSLLLGHFSKRFLSCVSSDVWFRVIRFGMAPSTSYHPHNEIELVLPSLITCDPHAQTRTGP